MDIAPNKPWIVVLILGSSQIEDIAETYKKEIQQTKHAGELQNSALVIVSHK